MKIVISLGNPGKQYEYTRHNAGFIALEKFAKEHNINFALAKRLFSKIYIGSLGSQQVILAKPQTFMNESGKAVKALCSYYKINPEINLLVVHDDTDLPLGKWRAAYNSSSAGHKGVQNIIDLLGTQKFHRLRIGVESRPLLLSPRVSGEKGGMPTEEFVLHKFTDEELKVLEDRVLPEILKEITKFIEA